MTKISTTTLDIQNMNEIDNVSRITKRQCSNSFHDDDFVVGTQCRRNTKLMISRYLQLSITLLAFLYYNNNDQNIIIVLPKVEAFSDQLFLSRRTHFNSCCPRRSLTTTINNTVQRITTTTTTTKLRAHDNDSPEQIKTQQQQQQQQQQQRNEEEQQNNEAATKLLQCPFSKSFPRYRIDLSSIKKEQKTKNKKGGFFSGLLPKEMILASERSKVEKMKSSKQNVIWKPDITGIYAYSMLWNIAADYLEESFLLSSSSSSSSSSPLSSLIVALPDASLEMVVNWIEIINWWMYDEQDKHDRGGGDIYEVLQIQLIDELSIPVIQIQYDSRTNLNENLQLLEEESDESTTSKNIIESIKNGTKSWVKRLLVDQGICPFTKSIKYSGQGLNDVGVPVGAISYDVTLSSSIIRLQADLWSSVINMLNKGPERRNGGISSILLAAPKFDNDFSLWSGPIFTMLEAGVVTSNGTKDIGIVCFHPKYATPDGTSWPGFGHMHSVPRLQQWYEQAQEEKDKNNYNYNNNNMNVLSLSSSSSSSSSQDGEEETSSPSSSCPSSSLLTTDEIAAGGAWQRRTPYATINVLRADQLEKAESRRTTGKLYAENIEKLVGKTIGIGSQKLAIDLENERR